MWDVLLTLYGIELIKRNCTKSYLNKCKDNLYLCISNDECFDCSSKLILDSEIPGLL